MYRSPPVTTATTRPRGRPAGASRADVLAAARAVFLRGWRIDVQAIAAELGVGRATLYRWFGSREGLIGEVLVAEFDALADAAQRDARGRGPARLLDAFDRINRGLAEAPALRRFLEHERDTALRILTSSAGAVQPRAVARIAALIEAEDDRPAIDAQTLAYAIVRLAEAFLYNDAAAGIRGDVARLRDVEALLLGVTAGTRAARSSSGARPSARS
jgi:AcrR family transcriptional regulator